MSTDHTFPFLLSGILTVEGQTAYAFFTLQHSLLNVLLLAFALVLVMSVLSVALMAAILTLLGGDRSPRGALGLNHNVAYWRDVNQRR